MLQQITFSKVSQVTTKSLEKNSIGAPWEDQRLILGVSRYDILKIGDNDDGLCAKNA